MSPFAAVPAGIEGLLVDPVCTGSFSAGALGVAPGIFCLSERSIHDQGRYRRSPSDCLNFSLDSFNEIQTWLQEFAL
jgi:hypothetical protein